VSCAVGFVDATGALRTPLVGPFPDDAGTFQHDELVPDDAGLGMNVPLGDSEREDGGVNVLGKRLLFRERLGAAYDADTEDWEDAADLVEERFGV